MIIVDCVPVVMYTKFSRMSNTGCWADAQHRSWRRDATMRSSSRQTGIDKRLL